MKSIEDVNDDKIFRNIVSFINSAEKDKDLKTGEDKKKFVLESFKLFINDNLTFNRYEPFINIIIDGLVSISNKDISLYKNSFKKIIKNCKCI